MRINTNISALNAYRNLVSTDSRLNKSLERLSSGLRINRASDDAAGLAISEKMRAQVRGLNQSIRNSQDAISLIQTAEGALNETHAILQRMRELSVQAANDTLTASDRMEIQKEVDQLITEIDRIGNTTEFNTKKLLDGTTSALYTTDKLTTKVFMRDGLRVVDQFGQKAPGGGNYKLEIQATPGVAQVQKTDIMRVKHGNITENTDMGWNQAKLQLTIDGTAATTFNANTVGDIFTFEFKFEDGVEKSVEYTINSAQTSQDFMNAVADLVAADNVLGNRISIQATTVINSGTSTVDIQSLTKGAAGNFELNMTRNVFASAASGSATLGLASATTTMGFAAGGTTGFVYTLTNTDPSTITGVDVSQSGLEAFDATGLAQGAYRITTLKAADMGQIGTDASLSYVAQYRQADADQGSLIRPVGFGAAAAGSTSLTTANNTEVNSLMAFEVTGIGGANNEEITVKVRSWEMDRAGNRSYYESEETFNRQTTAIHTLTVGTIEFANFNFAEASATGTITVGDQFLLNIDPLVSAGATGDLVNITRTIDENENVVSHSFNLYKNEGAWNNSTQIVDYLTIDTVNGGFQHSEVTLRFGQFETYNDNGGTAITFDRTPGAGELATSAVRLEQIEAFWDKSGNFLVGSPQTVSLVQGDGKRVDVTFFASDTVQDVVVKLNDAIANQITGLGQEALTGQVHADKFVSYVTKGALESEGLEATQGTFLIRSAMAGSYGELTFVGNEDFIKALSLTTIQDATENVFNVTVRDAHTNKVVTGANNVKVEGNLLVGKVHQNVDVEFYNMSGIKVTWDTERKTFNLTGGFDNKAETFVHLADNTMVFHIGANPLQDVGAAIGDMRAAALGVDKILVTNRDAANDAISTLDRAIQRVSGERSKMGALQNRLEHTINNLGVAAENLSAAESRIRDLDFAMEMMEFTRNQIMLQAGTAMLAQANMKPQSVLQLLG